MSTPLADDIVDVLRGVDQAIRDTIEEIANPRSSDFCREVRLDDLPRLVALRKELVGHDQQAYWARVRLLERAKKCIETSAEIRLEREQRERRK